ncbi:MAG TPA: aminotransferase class III-fold pyridoxal phosphate-dependent enzyme [Actinomycetota bacterium]|nr:aminotransferase class III-fold pyridoxal phosphate-dependent enzyme [Actinomycetota bacterium]
MKDESAAGLADRDPLEAPPPAFTSAQAEALAAETFGIAGRAEPLVSERDQNFKILTPAGDGFVLKIMNPAEDPAVAEMQTFAMLHVAETDPGLPVMRLVPALDGSVQAWATGPDGRTHVVRMVTLMPGRLLEPIELRREALPGFGAASARLARALRGFFHPAAHHSLLWNIRNALDLRPLLPSINDPRRRRIAERVIDRFEEHVHPVFSHLRAQVIHNDLTSDNTLFDEEQHVSGILDFGDMAHTAVICDLVSTVDALMGERPDHFESLEATAAGFASVLPLEDEEVSLLPDLLLTRWTTTAAISAWRAQRYPENAEYITGWDAGVWTMLDLFNGMGAPAYERRIREALMAATGRRRSIAVGGSIDELVERRRRLFGPAISPLSYERPLHLVGGRGVWLYDAEGRAYLDAYNNVPVVGHAHPHVVDAIARQAASLNTNTRYLHRSALELAERLVATMPDGLDTVMFVNTGSEANDLAWRMATTFTGAGGGVVTRFAYHGVTTAIADLSPEEWLGSSPPAHVATIAPPDPREGFGGDDPGGYAAEVDRAVAELRSRGFGPAAMLIDGGFTSDGVFTPAPDVLGAAVDRWRGAGGLFVADEVQVGYGRGGSHLWGFRHYGLTPDFVTLGKPMGNGHPVAAVITRSEIAARFAHETEFFSTFGGNPVACEAGLAVLEVIEREGLVSNAQEMGRRLVEGLRGLMARHPLIGEVRSMGLLVGADLVRDRGTGEPASAEADRVSNAMRERGVLVGTTGPTSNVLKIRPPLVIASREIALLIQTLDEVLVEVEAGR